jgi:hypothetical protein
MGEAGVPAQPQAVAGAADGHTSSGVAMRRGEGAASYGVSSNQWVGTLHLLPRATPRTPFYSHTVKCDERHAEALPSVAGRIVPQTPRTSWFVPRAGFRRLYGAMASQNRP